MTDFPREGPYAHVDQRLARSVLLGLVLLGAVAITGPLISYRSDVAELHRVFSQRMAREALVHATALGNHFQMLQSELERLAARPEIDLTDNSLAPEQELLAFTHHNSALFAAVAVLDTEGHPLWSEPRGALPEATSLLTSPWYQQGLALQRPVVDALAPRGRMLVVSVPVIRGGRTTGMVVGLIDPGARLLPGASAQAEHFELLLMDPEGDVFLPENPPAWAMGKDFPSTVAGLLGAAEGRVLTLDGRDHYVAMTRVGSTRLSLLMSADRAAVIAPMRTRFLYQLVFITVLQSLTVLLFAAYLRHSYRAFLKMETRAAQQEKMAALGRASSLIAHEVKNSLNGLSAAASLSDPSGQSLSARSMRGQVDRLAHLASSLLQFGKPASAQRVLTPITQLVRDTVDSLRALPEAEDVTLRIREGAPAAVDCDPLLFTTALDNLVRNAVEAGATAKDTGRVPSPRVEVAVYGEGGGAKVVVEDNAGGPPAGFEASLFQPFVTSKPKGIGLGLSMARQAVEQQGGTLRFERTVEGSRFIVQLPNGGKA
jgi:signal transduction histidine kinase